MTSTMSPQLPGHAPGWKWRSSSAGQIERPWDLDPHVSGICERGWHTDCPQAPLNAAAGCGQCACPCHQLCQWFVRCDHRAAGLVAHPVLGVVPTCTRCAERMDLTFIEQES